MLKALEIVGFKSFADKTRFDFPPGITVVVGPNGSGKSNVVDAIKWVLGEQSAKSLRGKDMSDVIFKGAGTGNGRRASNTAEATIILDNVERRLDCDTDEVHITRRVFRSGEGEYLINGDACRLKDIKDLFRGTGIGTDAYSLIEQGKVDRLLQASTKDRRAIFEEAAGISRFKAKKVEAQRRLARVDQNLLRLSDIVDEVGSRYRSVKAQASKASRYKEYSDRLRQLRVELSFVDWRSSSEQLETLLAEETDLTEKLGSSESQLQKVDSDLAELQTQINEFSDTLLELEGNASKAREAISRFENVVESESKRKEEIAERQTVVVAQLGEQTTRIESLKATQAENKEKKQSAAGIIEQKSQEFEAAQQKADQCLGELETYRQSERELATQQSELEKKWADQQRRSFEIETEVNALKKACEQQQHQLDLLISEIQEIAVELNSVEAAERKLEEETAEKDDALARARQTLKDTKSQLKEFSDELQELKSEKSGVAQRAKVIEELEKRFEGIQSGAKDILERSKSDSPGPFRHVYGLVADLIQVQVQHATLIDGILGDWSQFVVCEGEELSQWLENTEPDIAGRVGIFRLDSLPKPTPAYHVDLSGRPNVVGRADQVVTVDSEHQSIVDHLLGNVWIVRSLKDALRLRAEHSGRVRYATLEGEIVEPDGALVLGPPAAEVSLISRRSELRSLKKRLIDLDNSIGNSSEIVKDFTRRAKLGESEVERLLNEHTIVSKQLAQHQLQREGLQKQVKGLKQSHEEAKSEFQQTSSKKEASDKELEALTSQMRSDDESLQKLVADRSGILETVEQSQSELEQLEVQKNELKLALATEEKNLEGLVSAIAQVDLSLEETTGLLQKTDSEIEANQARLTECESQITQAQQSMSEWVSQRDELTQKIVSHSDDRKQVVARREELQEANSELTQNTKQWQSRKHRIELELGQLQNLQDSLVERLRDDYGIEVAELTEANIDFVIEDRDEAEQEVESLKRKISGIGAVNTDALQELEDLEGRYLSLEEQFQDLVKAKESLERIIVRINSDSRKIFVETLEAIRTNFQALYRKNFGGGKADIVLEEGVDELEAGIDIVATPPGKAEFSNSLLSGGEKALTAVSLLLAIFQFRPSPFCVLDEVDAPFDEANIGRFVEVLKGFLGWTRFVVVTHSKKTMTAADTLYGVTMLESGISTKVSVRFEDVDDKGNISKTAVEKSQAENSQGDDTDDKGVA